MRLVFALAGLAASLQASSIYINDFAGFRPKAIVAGSTVAQGKYKLDVNNWDMSLSSTGGTSTGAEFVQNNIGGSGLSGVTWDFILANLLAGSDPAHPQDAGMKLTMTSGSTTAVLAWGTFPSLTPGALVKVAPTLQPAGTGPAYGPLDREFNALQLVARSSSDVRRAYISNLAFASPSLIQSDGSAFQTVDINGSTIGPNPGDLFGTATGNYTQYIFSDTPLNTVNWRLSGQVRLTYSGSNPNEGLKFYVNGLTVESVPEPGAGLLLGGGLLALGMVRRLRQRQP